MKRLLILLISLAIAVVACGQEVLKRDLEIRKTAPLLNLNGSGAVLQFYNGDVSLTQSSNLLTLSGGNFSLGANSLLGSGSIGATGSRLLKGWFTDLEITNSPTVNGVSIASIYAPLASPTFTGTVTGTFSGNLTGNVTGTSSLVTGFTRNSGTVTLSGGHGITFTTTGTTTVTLPTSGTLMTNPMSAAGDIIIGGTSGVPSRLAATTNGYVLTLSAGVPVWAAAAGGEAIESRVDSIVAVLSDTLNIETLLDIDLDTDTVADLSELRLKANIASPTFTGTVTMPTPFTLGATSVTASGAELNLLDGVTSIETYSTENYGSTGTGDIVLSTGATVANMTIDDVSPTELGYLDGIVSPIKQASDTIPIFVFGLGSGVAADTAVFNDNAIAGSFYNAGSDTLKITSLMGVLAEGSGTETIAVQVSWHSTFKSGSATNLNSSALTVNSITTGTSDTSFANDKIPPGVFVWCTLSGTSAGNKPSLLILTMSGYKIPRY